MILCFCKMIPMTQINLVFHFQQLNFCNMLLVIKRSETQPRRCPEGVSAEPKATWRDCRVALVNAKLAA